VECRTGDLAVSRSHADVKFRLRLPDGPHDFATTIENWAMGDVLLLGDGLLVRILAIQTRI
jgi:hypothetical protein